MSHFAFVTIAVCLLLALGSFPWVASRRDWALLVCALAATLVADYFLIVTRDYEWGVRAFVTVQIFYLNRIALRMKEKQPPTKALWRTPKNILKIICVLLAFFLLFMWLPLRLSPLLSEAAVYAGLFAVNLILYGLYCFAPRFRNESGRRRMFVGMVLFALCDINVGIINAFRLGLLLPGEVVSVAQTLVWVFYLPAQWLLAVSAIKIFSGRGPHERHPAGH